MVVKISKTMAKTTLPSQSKTSSLSSSLKTSTIMVAINEPDYYQQTNADVSLEMQQQQYKTIINTTKPVLASISMQSTKIIKPTTNQQIRTIKNIESKTSPDIIDFHQASSQIKPELSLSKEKPEDSTVKDDDEYEYEDEGYNDEETNIHNCKNSTNNNMISNISSKSPSESQSSSSSGSSTGSEGDGDSSNQYLECLSSSSTDSCCSTCMIASKIDGDDNRCDVLRKDVSSNDMSNIIRNKEILSLYNAKNYNCYKNYHNKTKYNHHMYHHYYYLHCDQYQNQSKKTQIPKISSSSSKNIINNFSTETSKNMNMYPNIETSINYKNQNINKINLEMDKMVNKDLENNGKQQKQHNLLIKANNGSIRGKRNNVRNTINNYNKMIELLNNNSNNISRNYLEEEKNKCLLYVTSLAIIRKTLSESKGLESILENHFIKFELRDVYINDQFRRELLERLEGKLIIPALFLDGKFLGSFAEIEKLNESGQLVQILQRFRRESLSANISDSDSHGQTSPSSSPFVSCPESSLVLLTDNLDTNDNINKKNITKKNNGLAYTDADNDNKSYDIGSKVESGSKMKSMMGTIIRIATPPARKNCPRCGNKRFVNCTRCHGSGKCIVHHFPDCSIGLKCTQCNRSGLIQCPNCSDNDCSSNGSLSSVSN